MTNSSMKRIYFLGGLNIEPGNETAHFIKSGQEVMTCPPIGEFLEVPDYVALDIVSKYGADVFTLNQRIAEDVAAGKAKFERSQVDGKTFIKEVMSDDEVVARYNEIMAQKAEAEEEPEAPEEPAEKPPAKTTAKKGATKARRTKQKVEE